MAPKHNDKKEFGLEELYREVASRTGVKLNDSKMMTRAVLNAIKEMTLDGRDVVLMGFGSFKVKYVKEREGNSFGERVVIPAHNRMWFKPSSIWQRDIKAMPLVDHEE